jgi:hypothetical protein
LPGVRYLDSAGVVDEMKPCWSHVFNSFFVIFENTAKIKVGGENTTRCRTTKKQIVEVCIFHGRSSQGYHLEKGFIALEGLRPNH